MQREPQTREREKQPDHPVIRIELLSFFPLQKNNISVQRNLMRFLFQNLLKKKQQLVNQSETE